MGNLYESKKKAQEASDSLMKRYHQAKQKAMSKWGAWFKNRRNPDCYTLDGNIVVRLDLVNDDVVVDALHAGNIYQDKTGAFYGVVCEYDD